MKGCANNTCASQHHYSQHGEDLVLLPMLLRASGFRPGTFVEIGAFDGVTLSNTLLLERCYNWTGLLVEADPRNYRQLARSRRRAAKVHSGVCRASRGGTMRIQSTGKSTSRQVGTTTAYSALFGSGTNRTVSVPCKPLSQIMADHGLGSQRDRESGVTLLSLDVEGAEVSVLETVDPSVFSIVLVEADGGAHDKRVDEVLTRANLTLFREIRSGPIHFGGVSRVYVRRDALRARWSQELSRAADCPSRCSAAGEMSTRTLEGNAVDWNETRCIGRTIGTAFERGYGGAVTLRRRDTPQRRDTPWSGRGDGR